jgi:rRNA maturation endonuclease Nob1
MANICIRCRRRPTLAEDEHLCPACEHEIDKDYEDPSTEPQRPREQTLSDMSHDNP